MSYSTLPPSQRTLPRDDTRPRFRVCIPGANGSIRKEGFDDRVEAKLRACELSIMLGVVRIEQQWATDSRKYQPFGQYEHGLWSGAGA